MGETNITKCTECSSRDLDKDEMKGEVVCNDCGTVLDEMQIDYHHPSTQVGENAHISSTKNDSLGSRTTRRTIIDRKEARKAGMGNLIRAEQKAHAKKNVRGHDILDKIKELSNSESVIKAAEDVIKACFTKNPEYEGYGELPLNQMRFMFSEQGKDADYVISVCTVGTKKMLSDFGRIGFYNWQEDAKKLGLEANDVLVASKIITERIKRICRGANLNPYGKIQLRRSRALYAFEQKLRHCLREKKVANAESLLEWVTERIHALDNDGEGPMSDIRPNMLLAMITVCGLEEFEECKMTKKGVAEIFNLTVGGVNAKLKKDAPDTTNIKSFIKNFNRRTGVA